VLLDQECAHTAAALQAAALDASREAPGAAFVFGDAPPTELEPACVAAHGFGDEPAELPGPQAAPAADAPAAAHSSCADCACGITWQLPPGVALTDCSIVWVGGANAALLRLLMSLPLLPDGSTVPCARYDPAARVLEASASQTQEAQRVLKRRYYLVERAKQASIVGLVAGTLGVAGFRAALERVRALAEAAGKKTYTFLVGKPNPAKLANFPEVCACHTPCARASAAQQAASVC
jgi:diphthamide biosynthesis protein 2